MPCSRRYPTSTALDHLSIIIPSFNEEKRLGVCLRSIRTAIAACARPDLQTETIVADTGSSGES